MIIKEITLPSRPDLLTLPSEPTSDTPYINHYNFEQQYLKKALVTAHQSQNIKGTLM